MSDTVHERPGVYSTYTVSSAIYGTSGKKTVGLVAVNTVAEALEAVTLSSYSQAVTTLGSGDLAEMVGAILSNGASSVVVIPVASDDDYADGFAVMDQIDDISIVMCDSTDDEVHEALAGSVASCAQDRRERIAVITGGASETVAQMVARAADLNSERVVLVAPGSLMTAAAVAGAIASQTDPALPLGGAELTGIDSITTKYTENEIDLLVLGGVTAVETRSGATSVIRGITTRTKTSDVADSTWRELSVILIVDDVIPTIRTALAAKFKRAKNTEQTRGAIAAQVVLELESKLSSEIITAYDGVSVTADDTDPTLCVVDFSFAVANTLNQIWVNAYITV